MSTFIPVIKRSAINGTKEATRLYRSAVLAALEIESCAEAIAPFKSNGNVHGHKLLDDSSAVEALRKAAPENIRSTLDMDVLNLHQKIQQLNQAMRSQWVMDKYGKVDGTPNPKMLKRQPKQEAASA